MVKCGGGAREITEFLQYLWIDFSCIAKMVSTFQRPSVIYFLFESINGAKSAVTFLSVEFWNKSSRYLNL